MKKNNRIFIVLIAFFFSFPIVFAEDKTAVQLFDAGVEAQANENWYIASQSYMEAIQLNPVYGDAWFHLAQCSYQLGEFDLVLIQLDEAEKYSKDDNSINNLRGMSFIAMGNFSDARKIFEKILEKTPNDVDARFGLAELDLFDGKISGAERQYTEALKRQSENRKALLSLAIVSAQLGKIENAKKYINQALSLYSEEAEVHYIASIIETMHGDIKKAEKHCRIAVEVDGNNSKAYELLSKIRYLQKDYNEVIDLCDFIIGRNRNNSIAWYLKGAALKAQGKYEDAIRIWSIGIKINPIDEIMRCAMEMLVNKYIPLEDERRIEWADFHIQNAREYSRRYDGIGTIYEYQRALKIYPSNTEARMNFAGMLEMKGLHEGYLEQLIFVQQNRNDENLNSVEKKEMSDTIEAYEDLLQDSLAKKWNVQPFYLEKTRWSLGIYYVPSNVSQRHVENNSIAADFANDIFSGLSAGTLNIEVQEVNGFGDAYQKARTSRKDYFIILSVDEGTRDITLEYAVYSARTGSKIKEDSLYSTGNFRYSSVFRNFRSDVMGILSIRGNLIDRKGKTALIDLGISENIVNGAVFEIVRKNSIETSGTGAGVTYKDSDILGSFTVTTAGEEISEGILEYRGFYDRINTGDEVVLIAMPKTDEQNALEPGQQNENVGIQNVPNADANGISLNSKPGLTAEDLGVRRTPSFIDLIRSIY